MVSEALRGTLQLTPKEWCVLCNSLYERKYREEKLMHYETSNIKYIEEKGLPKEGVYNHYIDSLNNTMDELNHINGLLEKLNKM